MDIYARVARSIEPKKEKLKGAEAALAEAEGKLASKKAELKQVQDTGKRKTKPNETKTAGQSLHPPFRPATAPGKPPRPSKQTDTSGTNWRTAGRVSGDGLQHLLRLGPSSATRRSRC